MLGRRLLRRAWLVVHLGVSNGELQDKNEHALSKLSRSCGSSICK